MVDLYPHFHLYHSIDSFYSSYEHALLQTSSLTVYYLPAETVLLYDQGENCRTIHCAVSASYCLLKKGKTEAEFGKSPVKQYTFCDFIIGFLRDHVVLHGGREFSKGKCNKTGKKLDVDRKNEGNQ